MIAQKYRKLEVVSKPKKSVNRSASPGKTENKIMNIPNINKLAALFSDKRL